MRQSEKNRNTQGVSSEQETISKKITEVNQSLIKTFDFSSNENFIEKLIYVWIVGDFIDGLPKDFKSDVLNFINDYKSLMKTIYQEEENIEFNYLQLFNDFSDNWSRKQTTEILTFLTDAFIHSEIANDIAIRGNVFIFLNEAREYTSSMYKIQKKNIELAK